MWRRGRFGPFIACSDYPNCKYIKKKEAREIGLTCPECGRGPGGGAQGPLGPLLLRLQALPRVQVHGLQQAPAEPCPDCGRAYLLEKETKKEGKVVFCGNEACHYKRAA